MKPSFWVSSYFQGAFAVSFRECTDPHGVSNFDFLLHQFKEADPFLIQPQRGTSPPQAYSTDLRKDYTKIFGADHKPAVRGSQYFSFTGHLILVKLGRDLTRPIYPPNVGLVREISYFREI